MAKVKVEFLGEVPIALIKITNRARFDKGEIDVMALSLQERGQIQPVTLGAGMQLRAGERRILGAMQLGWETIRAEMRHDDDAIEALSVERDENEIRKPFTWDELARLEQTIFKLKAKKDHRWSIRKQEEYRDVSKSTIGRRLLLAEALELIPELADCPDMDSAWKEYKKLEEVAGIQYLRKNVPESIRQAPLWANDHYIVDDALVGMKRLAVEVFDFAEVDPPYGIDLLRRKSRNEEEGHTSDYNEIDAKEFPRFMQAVAEDVYRLLKPNAFAVFWYGMQWHCDMLRWLKRAGFAVNPMPAMWYKGNSGQTAQPDVALASCYEPFLLARKGQPKMSRQGRGNVFHYASVPPGKKIHSTEKPVELLSDILNTILFPGSNILVPFLGSGVTLRAAYGGGHTGMGFDLSHGNKERFMEVVAQTFGTLPELDEEDEDATEDA